MLRQVKLLRFLLIFVLYFTLIGCSENKVINKVTSGLEGQYELVSETTELKKPEKRVYKREAPDWKGLWIFEDRHFSYFLRKNDNPPFKESKRHEQNQSFSGSYIATGDKVSLKILSSNSSADIGRPVELEYRVEGDLITMKQQLTPYPEDIREGQITILLRKLKR